MQSFVEATGVRAEGGGFVADLDPGWAVGDKIHGGYLMAVLGRAVAAAAPDHPHPVAISTTFLWPPLPGRATITVDPLRTGRGSAQFRARLEQDGRPCAEALLTQGVLDESASWWSAAPEPHLPPEPECLHLRATAPGAPFVVPLLDVVEHRVDPACMGFATGRPASTGRVGGWLRLADGSDWDPLSLLVGLDPAPPVSLSLGVTAWAPTISMTAYLRRLPAPGPIRVVMHATEITAGRMDETAMIWDAKGHLVAQATQLAAVRT